MKDDVFPQWEDSPGSPNRIHHEPSSAQYARGLCRTIQHKQKWPIPNPIRKLPKVSLANGIHPVAFFRNYQYEELYQ